MMDDYVERIAWLQSQILPHQGVVRRYFEAHAPAQLDVDDILAEALVRCYTSNNWRDVEDGRRFLFAVARNYVLDAARWYCSRTSQVSRWTSRTTRRCLIASPAGARICGFSPRRSSNYPAAVATSSR